jgi:hypothetical protein
MESAAASSTNPLIEHALFFLRNRQARERTLVIFSSDGKACTVTSLPTRQEVICCGIQLYFGLPILGGAKTSAEIEQEYQVKQFARRVARGSIPGKRAAIRILKYAKTKDLEPETFIRWIQEALEYKYPL